MGNGRGNKKERRDKSEEEGGNKITIYSSYENSYTAVLVRVYHTVPVPGMHNTGSWFLTSRVGRIKAAGSIHPASPASQLALLRTILLRTSRTSMSLESKEIQAPWSQPRDGKPCRCTVEYDSRLGWVYARKIKITANLLTRWCSSYQILLYHVPDIGVYVQYVVERSVTSSKI